MKKILASSISGWAVLGLISITLTQATPANTARLSYTYGDKYSLSKKTS